MSELAGRTALVTGAAGPMGTAAAQALAAAGCRVALVDLPGVRLDAAAAVLPGSIAVGADLSLPEAPQEVAAQVARVLGPVDVLVNNAGVLEQGRFARIPARRHQELIDLNVSALTAMVAQFLPPMIRRGRGRILNVASIAAFQPVPMLACYAATKAYVLSLTEALAEELRDTGVTVTALCPGITATDMLTKAARANSRLDALPGFLVGDVDAVAAAGYRACMSGDVIAVPGEVNWAAAVAARNAPKWLVRRIAGAVGRSVA